MSSVKVLIVDDQALLRGSFRLLVDTAPDLEVVGEADKADFLIGLPECVGDLTNEPFAGKVIGDTFCKPFFVLDN